MKGSEGGLENVKFKCLGVNISVDRKIRGVEEFNSQVAWKI